MQARVLVGLLAIPVLSGIIWLGYPLLTILITLAALWGMYEFSHLARGIGARIPLVPSLLLTLLFVLNGQIAEQNGNSALFLIIATFAVALLWVATRPKYNIKKFIRNWLIAAIGPLYVGFLLSHALFLRESGTPLYDGRDWLFVAVFATFASDTAAFFVGTWLGRHRMAPKISPKKTWEGAAGGLAASICALSAMKFIFDLPIGSWESVVLGFGLGIGSQIGDLSESWVKRIAGVKDTGVVIPGHGGLLDRLDSLLVTIPVTYYSMAIIIT